MLRGEGEEERWNPGHAREKNIYPSVSLGGYVKLIQKVFDYISPIMFDDSLTMQQL